MAPVQQHASSTVLMPPPATSTACLALEMPLQLVVLQQLWPQHARLASFCRIVEEACRHQRAHVLRQAVTCPLSEHQQAR